VNPDSSTARQPPRWATLANALTATRVVCVPLIAASILLESRLAALGVFAWAVATDLADGRLARNRGEASSLGGLLDHGADALFCSVGLGALAWTGAVPAPLPVLVAAAFLQYMLDSRSIAGRPLRASFLGRWNGIFYFALIGVPVVRDGLGLPWPSRGLVLALGWLLVASTVVSMGDRAWAFVSRSR
jgi:phosphatidylglycerophosphate synthase